MQYNKKEIPAIYQNVVEPAERKSADMQSFCLASSRPPSPAAVLLIRIVLWVKANHFVNWLAADIFEWLWNFLYCW